MHSRAHASISTVTLQGRSLYVFTGDHLGSEQQQVLITGLPSIPWVSCIARDRYACIWETGSAC